MLTELGSRPLYRVSECPDLMADACLCDDQNRLIFISLWGRDTAVQEVLARLTLGAQEAGLDELTLIGDDFTLPVFVHNADSLIKRATRALRGTLFGTLLNVWLFERACVKPDKANATAVAVLPKEAENRTERLWTLVKETCPLPLLDHWRETVLEVLTSGEMLLPLSRAVGPLEGYRLGVDVPQLTARLSELIRDGSLGITPAASENTALPIRVRRAA